VALTEDDLRHNGRVFIPLESDFFAPVDGDDVRDPETGDIHLAFTTILELLGLRYTDVSTTGAGPEFTPITTLWRDSRLIIRAKLSLRLRPSRRGRTMTRPPS